MELRDRIHSYLLKSGKRDPKPKRAIQAVSEDDEWVICEPTLGELWLEWFGRHKVKLIFGFIALTLIWIVTFTWAITVSSEWNNCHLDKECRALITKVNKS